MNIVNLDANPSIIMTRSLKYNEIIFSIEHYDSHLVEKTYFFNLIYKEKISDSEILVEINRYKEIIIDNKNIIDTESFILDSNEKRPLYLRPCMESYEHYSRGFKIDIKLVVEESEDSEAIFSIVPLSPYNESLKFYRGEIWRSFYSCMPKVV